MYYEISENYLRTNWRQCFRQDNLSGYKRTPSLSRNVIKMPHVWPHIASCCFCCYCQQSHNTLSILRYLYEQIQIIPPLPSLPLHRFYLHRQMLVPCLDANKLQESRLLTNFAGSVQTSGLLESLGNIKEYFTPAYLQIH